MQFRRMAAAFAVALATAVAAFSQSLPPTTERPVTDTYYGIKVVDPYRWLEDWSQPEVQTWTAAQTGYTRAQLDARPFGDAVRDRVKALGSSPQPRWTGLTYRPGVLFAIKYQPPLNQPLIVSMGTAADPTSERVVVDPNRLDSSGTTTIDFYEPSLDGRLVAVSLSKGGTEDGTVHVFEVATGKELADRVPRANGGTAGGGVAWDRGSRGFFYARYPHAGERPAADLPFYQQVYYHKLGTSADTDTYVIGREFPRIAENRLQTSADGKYTVVTVLNGDGGEFAHYIASLDGKWRQISSFTERASIVAFGTDDSLYVLSHRSAPHGAILKMSPVDQSALKAREIYRAADGDIADFEVTRDHLVVSLMIGGPSEVHVMDLEGKRDTKVNVPALSAVTQLVAVGNDVLGLTERFTEPAAWYRIGPTGTFARTDLGSKSAVDYSDIEVERVEATSKDGTRVPVSILHRKGIRLDGTNPALLYGYGGYGVNRTPNFSATRVAWLEQGGVYAEANIRGGGEFGDLWHTSGHLTKKQNVFDDFAAAAQALIDRKYTSSAKLAMQGASNGGLLMAATLTQRPSLARAVVSGVGVYDILRAELWPNGEFNTTEFGTVKNPEHFKAMYAYAPLEHIVKGTAYPAVLLLSGTNDPRVNPGDSRRLAARLQAATKGRPVLLRVNGAGHVGTSLSEGLSQVADVYTFLFWQLGVAYKPVAAQPNNTR
jgi:prolyl oligopeptidase